ncbi:membrane protein [Caldovatus sediminis]|uniref:Probable membrane transporter protein n=1 Tax=Caldovatus sediminis TaxID=2041189 RepID=A0A8J2Z807_9PROT|nr:sulfite exporter TauE/SafE family protein [Caldovatus sediminis]GGG18018.1 membrane protein [Caldovatus sediminis]
MGDPFHALPGAEAMLGVALAAVLGGLSRGFSGFGAALVFVPLASAAVGPREAVPVLALLESFAVLVFLPNAWRLSDRREAGLMAAGAVAGVPVGAAVLASAEPVALRWGLAGLVLAAVALLASGWRYRGRPAPPLTLAVGGVGGVMSGAAMLGGVAPATYWLGGARASAARVRANMNLYFAALTAVVVGAYAVAGLLGWRTGWLALAAGPSYALGLVLGTRLFGLASERVFRLAAYGLILASGVAGMPVWDGIWGGR